MQHTIGQILPSLEALGLWSYWIIGLASMLEAFFATGIFVPGTLIVEAGGALVQQGALDYLDLVWFVAIGSVLGGEASYWVGVLARTGLQRRWQPAQSPAYQRAERLFRRHGGFALVLGRFLGPLAGFVSFAASVAGMERRKFLIWNIVSGIPYALVQIAFGFFLGDVISQLGPLATRIALFGAAIALVLLVLWWMILRIERMLPFLLSVFHSILAAIGDNPDVQALATRHPKSARFIRSRFDRTHFGGLTASLLMLIAVYILLVWIGSATDFLMADPIVATDVRLANLAHAFWSPGALRFFTYVTALGDWRVVTLVLLSVLTLVVSRARADLVVGLFTALLGNLVSVSLLKWIFDRPRPDLAYFVETSGSFPSGHAALSVAFFGMLFYIAWRLKWLGPLMAAILAASVAFLIGLSRIYLVEHYLSDVLNGWLVGGLWLVIGIAAAEWWHEAHPRPPHRMTRKTGRAPVLVALMLLLAGAWATGRYERPRNHPVDITRPETVQSAGAIFSDGKAPVSTQSIGGTALEPVNIIVIAPDFGTLERAMGKAGWAKARAPGLVSLLRALGSVVGNTPDGRAPVTPYFWNGAPNEASFQRPGGDNTLRQRHHVRFWKTRFRTPLGARIFIGAASFDDGLDWTLLHHINPDIDAERDLLGDDLKKAGLAPKAGMLRLTAPHMGQSVAGDPWFSDGRALVLRLK